MKEITILFLLLFSASHIQAQVLDDKYISSVYSDKTVTCSMSIAIKPYILTDTIRAELHFKNKSEIPLFIQKRSFDNVNVFTSKNYIEEASLFRYSLLGESDFLHILTQYFYEICLREVGPGEEIIYSLIIPVSLATGLSGQVHSYVAIHTNESRARVGIQLDFGYLPKNNPSFPIISDSGKFDTSSQDNIIWMDSNIKQFTLGPIYVGVNR